MSRTLHSLALFGALLMVGGVVSWAGAQNPDARLQTSVRQADAVAALKQVLPPITKRLQIKDFPLPAASNQRMTRAQVTLLISDVWRHFAPARKLTPRPLPIEPGTLERVRDPEIRARLEELIKAGAISPVSPLVVGPEDAINDREFGRILGSVFNRLSYVTHLPGRLVNE
jgi:hypothetical protein